MASAKKKIQKDRGIKKNPDGTYTISSDEGAKRALQLQAEIVHSTNELVVDATELRKGAGRYMEKKKKDVIVYDEDRYARLIRGTTRSWDTDKLEKLLPKGLFRRVTKRTADAAKINELVAAEEIDLDDIQSAFIEKPNAPYLKTFVGDPDADKSN